MGDYILLIPLIFLPILMLVISVYLLALYSHPDDDKQSYFQKLLVVISLTISHIAILMIPLDLATNDLINMYIGWQVLISIMLFLIVILIPLATIYYEQDELLSVCKKIGQTLIAYIIFAIIFITLFLLSYLCFGTASIPVKQYQQNANQFMPSNNSDLKIQKNSNQIYIEMQLNFIICSIGLFCFLGCIILAVYGGNGIIQLPMDLINEFIKRPKIRSSKEMKEKKTQLQEQTNIIIEMGQSQKQDINEEVNGYFQKRQLKQKKQKQIQKLKQQVWQLETEYLIFQEELDFSKQQQDNPCKYLSKLVLGLIFGVTSLIIIVQITLFLFDKSNYQQGNEFISKFLINNSGIFTTLIFGYLSIYMIWITMKGVFTLGLGIPFFFTLFPVKVNDTYINSLLVNVCFFMITSVGICQFCSQIFSQYTFNTAYYQIFTNQIQYLKIFSYFYQQNIFVDIFGISIALNILVHIIKSCCCKKK